MNGIAINRVTNANGYLNGANLLGKIAEFNLPQLKTLLSEHNALGLFGKMELPTGLDKMEATIKFTSLYIDVMAACYDMFNFNEVQVRCSVDEYTSAGRVAQRPCVIFLRGSFKDPSLGNLKQHDNVETDVKMNVIAIRVEVDSKPILEIDVLANIYKINGEDKLATYRQNIGG